jgi:ABC-2 type transport system ATP-binding protein
MNAAVSGHALTKSYGENRALDGVSFSVESGEIYGLLGPNGAGKSTLMGILSGFLRQDSGELSFDGEAAESDARVARQSIGLVPQDLAIYPTLTALENLSIFGNFYKLPKARIASQSERLLKAVDLYERRKEPVKNFSGGMKRRLNLIAALLHEPRLLLCDEPTTGVDPQSRNAIFEFLEAQNRQGLTILYTTHYMEEAERLCDRIAIIDRGKIRACGTQAELIALTGQQYELRFAPQDAGAVKGLLEGKGRWEDRSEYAAFIPGSQARLSELFKLLEEADIAEGRVRIQQPSLEQVFLTLTGRELRD